MMSYCNEDRGTCDPSVLHGQRPANIMLRKLRQECLTLKMLHVQRTTARKLTDCESPQKHILSVPRPGSKSGLMYRDRVDNS